MSLNERHDVPRCPRYAQDNAGRKRTPTLLEPADDISRPARFLADRQDEEYREENRRDQDWKVRIGNGFSNQRHQEVRRQHGGWHQQEYQDVPELVADSLRVEDVSPKVPDSVPPLFAIEKQVRQ